MRELIATGWRAIATYLIMFYDYFHIHNIKFIILILTTPEILSFMFGSILPCSVPCSVCFIRMFKRRR